jgi:hypothetical protein
MVDVQVIWQWKPVRWNFSKGRDESGAGIMVG